VILDVQMVSNLVTLGLRNCGPAYFTSIGACSQLETMGIESLPITELPDLSGFPRLKTVWLN
jgi:hypothetical protein